MSVKQAYKKSMNIYDGLITQSSLLGKIYMKLLWSGTQDNEIADKLLAHIPESFEGKILDIPVGTAIFTHNKWRSLTKSKITCLDYSEDMLKAAKERLEEYEHISCVQGDVGNLQFEDKSYDVVISMNGFHAFPDQPKAYDEIHRVLKEGGTFIACFYIKGQKKHTDLWVEHFLAKKGWFTGPFQTLEDVKLRLNSSYKNVEINVEGSMVYFKGEK